MNIVHQIHSKIEQAGEELMGNSVPHNMVSYKKTHEEGEEEEAGDFNATAQLRRDHLIHHLQIELERLKSEKLGESREFAKKRVEWAREKKQYEDEVRSLQQQLQASAVRSAGNINCRCASVDSKPLTTERRKKWEEVEYCCRLQVVGDHVGEEDGEFMRWCSVLMEQMKEEKKQKEEAIEKWKRLYLAIKMELDHLIQATTFFSHAHPQTQTQTKAQVAGEEGSRIEGLEKELEAKEASNAELRAKVVELEKERMRHGIEVDILKQSLRIMNTKPTKRCSIRKGVSKRLLQL